MVGGRRPELKMVVAPWPEPRRRSEKGATELGLRWELYQNYAELAGIFTTWSRGVEGSRIRGATVGVTTSSFGDFASSTPGTKLHDIFSFGGGMCSRSLAPSIRAPVGVPRGGR